MQGQHQFTLVAYYALVFQCVCCVVLEKAGKQNMVEGMIFLLIRLCDHHYHNGSPPFLFNLYLMPLSSV